MSREMYHISPQSAIGMHVQAEFVGRPDRRLGSWNRRPHSGYKVVFVRFAEGHPIGEPEDILTGFLSADGKALGRPGRCRHRSAGSTARCRRCGQPRSLARGGGQTGEGIGVQRVGCSGHIKKKRVGMTGIRGAVQSASALWQRLRKRHGGCDAVCEIHHPRDRLAVDAIGRPEPVNRLFSGSRLPPSTRAVAASGAAGSPEQIAARPTSTMHCRHEGRPRRDAG